MEYTKGPWACDVNGYSEYTIYGKADKSYICRVAGGINNRFDAHLIAAAPDLYEALKKAAYLYESCGVTKSDEYMTLIAALAKAEGR